jgi:hypothetical protein
MSLPGYSRARIAAISSGWGIGVAVGMGVRVWVTVGVRDSAGVGEAIAAGATVAVEGDAAAGVPQEFKVRAKIPRSRRQDRIGFIAKVL